MRARLGEAFAAKGLDFADYCAVLPWQNLSSYHALLRRSHVMLDTIGLSGFNTAMQALECGLPIVAYEGRFMRGRFASGILRSLGLDEFVAKDTQEYVERVVSLATDRHRLQSCRQRISETRTGLWHDRAIAREVEACLLNLG